MMRITWTALAVMGAALAARAADVAPQPAIPPPPTQPTFMRLPAVGTVVTEPRIHDPCMIHATDGYYVYATGRGIPAKKSTDLVHWTILPPVFDTQPEWINKELPGSRGFWAPDVSFFHGAFHLYYCASQTFGKNRSAIGVATSPTLDPSAKDYHWTDHGEVIDSQFTDSFNAIDPAVVLDEAGTPWLTFGSFWDGIHLRKLSAETGLLDPADKTLHSLAARPRSEGRALEAPSILLHDHHYYLFVSFDLCCRGVNSTYRMMVGRSEKVTGPYVDRAGKEMREGGGTLVIAGDPQGRLRGPGGGIAMHDGGRDLLVHHFYDANERGISKLQVRELVWSADGWPTATEPALTPARQQP